MKKHHLMFAACFMFLTGKPAFSATFEFDLVITDSHEIFNGYDDETGEYYQYEGMVRDGGWHVGDTVQLSIDYTPTCNFVPSPSCAYISAEATAGYYHLGGSTLFVDQSHPFQDASYISDSIQQHSLRATFYMDFGFQSLSIFMYDETLNFLDDSGNLNMSDDFEQSSLARAGLSFRHDQESHAVNYYREASMSASYKPTTLEPAPVPVPVAPVPVPPAFWLFGSGVLSMLLSMRRSFSRGSYQGG
jgi:hypothetical protein